MIEDKLLKSYAQLLDAVQELLGENAGPYIKLYADGSGAVEIVRRYYSADELIHFATWAKKHKVAFYWIVNPVSDKEVSFNLNFVPNEKQTLEAKTSEAKP